MRLSGRSQDISLGNSGEFLERFSIDCRKHKLPGKKRKKKTTANIVPLSFNRTEFQFKSVG